MGFIYDLYINRECQDCIYSELDLIEQKFWCTLREKFRDPEDAEECADIKTG